MNICIYNHFSVLRKLRQLKSFLLDDKELFIPHNQYHGCWWPGNIRSQGISNHGIDKVIKQYSWLSKGGVKFH